MVRIEDYAETLRGHRVLHLVGKGSKPAAMPIGPCHAPATHQSHSLRHAAIANALDADVQL